MIEIGKIQNLVIDRQTSIGLYLVDPIEQVKGKESVLLPQKEAPVGNKVGDTVEAFVYRDSQDRLIATTRKPKITLGEFAPLRVADVTKVGAFLDWGLEKDLLLPYHEQILKVQKGREYLVNLYIDKSDRLCATMKIYPLLKSETPYKVGDWIEGYIYQINEELGAFVAVENQYHGMILKQELTDDFHCGDKIKARVTEIRMDGKLALSPNKKAYKEIPKDAQKLIEKMSSNGGSLPFNDKTHPSIIKKELNMSKSSFKRAVGKLMKEKKIRQTDSGIEIIKK
ncbi:MAG: S1-like domain-containing RNA-binding protein [Eubacterium sp.]